MASYLLLDTNGLPVRGTLKSTFWKALFHLCETKGIVPALSEVTVHETVNLRKVTADQLIESMVKSHSQLSELTRMSPLYAPTGETVAQAYEAELVEHFAVLPLDGEHAREALRREAMRVLPAREGVGGRDTAIWLTLIARLEAGDEIHFVTNNSKDFGKGGLHAELRDEIDIHAAALNYYPTTRDFLAAIATKIDQVTFEMASVTAAFEDAARTQVVALLSVGDWDHLTTERAFGSHVELSELRFPQSYVVDDAGLALTQGRVTFSDAADRPAWGSGTFTGWLSFVPETVQPLPSEIDSLQVDFR
jgi:hypothetical protein